MTDANKFPVQLILRNILITAQLNMSDLKGSQLEEMMRNARPSERSIQNAAVVVSTLPIVCVYPFIQKYFIKGIMVGSVKG
jgi:putative aldouronate transport system permease protein